MARLLLHFDIRFPSDIKERYPNYYVGSVAGPSPIGIVELKKMDA